MRLRSSAFMKVGLTGTALAVVLLGACKSDDQPDARVIITFPDSPPANPIDARPAVPDAPPVTYGATALIQELSLLEKSGTTMVPSTAAPGIGGSILIDFSQNGLPHVDQIVSGTITSGCTATRYDSSMGKGPAPILDEGTVTFTVHGSGTVVPTCAFVGGTYRCIGAAGSAGAIVPVVGQSVSTFTGTAVNAFSADDVGRALVFGAGTAIPIVGFSATGPTLVLESEVTVAATGPWSTIAGTGAPVAFTAGVTGTPKGLPPVFLADADTVDVTFTPGAGAHFTAAQVSTTTPIAVGDAFQFDAASLTTLATGLLQATADVQVGCDLAGSHCGTALGSALTIDATDTTPTGAVDFPAPTAKSAHITCTQIGDGKITIPLNQLELVKAASPKRIRIVVARIGADLPKALAGVQLAAGHAFAMFEDAP